MESQPQNPEFRNNLENFHQCTVSWENPKLHLSSVSVNYFYCSN